MAEMLPNDVVSNVPDITFTDVTKQECARAFRSQSWLGRATVGCRVLARSEEIHRIMIEIQRFEPQKWRSFPSRSLRRVTSGRRRVRVVVWHMTPVGVPGADASPIELKISHGGALSEPCVVSTCPGEAQLLSTAPGRDGGHGSGVEAYGLERSAQVETSFCSDE